jgi:hypothetical protein
MQCAHQVMRARHNLHDRSVIDSGAVARMRGRFQLVEHVPRNGEGADEGRNQNSTAYAAAGAEEAASFMVLASTV